MKASEKGRVSIVMVLLEKGADVNVQVKNGSTALMLASREGHVEVVHLLLEAGADPNVRDKKRKSAADVARTPELRQAIDSYVPCFETARRPDPLAKECDALVIQFAQVPSLKDAIQHRDELQGKLCELTAVCTDFRAIAAVGKALKAAIAAVKEQPLSEDAYLTLADRHAALVQRVTSRCRELVADQDFESVVSLGEKHSRLKALDVSALPQAGATALPIKAESGKQTTTLSDTVVEIEMCDALIAQLPQVPALQEALKERDKLQAQFDATLAQDVDFVAIGRAGLALKAAVAAVKKLPLSEETYLTLAARHAALVQRVTARCRELVSAGEYDALEVLASKLEELQALDVSLVPKHDTGEPALAAAEAEEGTSDPVWCPPFKAQSTLG